MPNTMLAKCMEEIHGILVSSHHIVVRQDDIASKIADCIPPYRRYDVPTCERDYQFTLCLAMSMQVVHGTIE